MLLCEKKYETSTNHGYRLSSKVQLCFYINKIEQEIYMQQLDRKEEKT